LYHFFFGGSVNVNFAEQKAFFRLRKIIKFFSVQIFLDISVQVPKRFGDVNAKVIDIRNRNRLRAVSI